MVGERGLIVVMGSGETAPSMVTVHQRALAGVAPEAPAVLLDSPYGFQGNADDLTARTLAHFRERVGRELAVCSFRSAAAAAADPLAYEQSLALLREAGWAYAGPGSPSYSLRTWADTPLPDLLARVVERGGVLTFSSAAALTLGTSTVPVYEIYKVGEEPRWLDGLDLLGRLVGLRCALIPHWDNAEGGTTTPGSATSARPACTGWRPSCPTAPAWSASTSTPPSCSTSAQAWPRSPAGAAWWCGSRASRCWR